MNGSKKSYFIKNGAGKLVLIDEMTLSSMIANKRIKPSARIFCRTFNEWVKVSELSIYEHSKHSVVSNTITDEDASFDPNDPSYKILTLMDKVEDAKVFITKSKVQDLERVKSHQDTVYKLHLKLNESEVIINSLKDQNQLLSSQIKKLEQEHFDYLKNHPKKNHDLDKMKFESEIEKLKNLLKVSELNLKNEIEINNKLIVLSENQKKEIMNLFEARESIEADFNKLNKERQFYQSNLDFYQSEINQVSEQKNLLHKEIENLTIKYRALLEEIHLEREKNHSKTIENTNFQLEIRAIKNQNREIKNHYEDISQKYVVLKKEFKDLSLLQKESFTDLDGLKQEMKNEVEFEQVKNFNLEKSLKALQEKYKKIEKDYEHIKDLHEKSISTNKNLKESYDFKIKELKDQIKDGNKESKKDLDIKKLKSLVEQYKKKSVPLSEFSKVMKRLNVVERENKLLIGKSLEIARKFKTKNIEYMNLQKKLLMLKNSTKTPLIKDEEIEKNINDILDEVSTSNGKIKNSLQSIETFNLLQEDNQPNDDENLCEIDNSAIWSVKGIEKLKGTYTIIQLRNFIENGTIQPDNFVKKAGSWWKRLKNWYELIIPIIPVPGANGLKVFIKRDQIRVPLNETVKMATDDSSFSLEIIDLSSGGCQLKFMQKVPDNLVPGTTISIFFDSDSALKNSIVNGILRRIDREDHHQILGIQFVDLDVNCKRGIDNLVDSFLSNIKPKLVA